jgi:tRNA (guanine-N7-)-methyltransferase
MGKGRFIIEASNQNNAYNYIGLEKYPSVQVMAIKSVEKDYSLKEKNLRFISFDATSIKEIFEKNEIDLIYINFPDP